MENMAQIICSSVIHHPNSHVVSSWPIIRLGFQNGTLKIFDVKNYFNAEEVLVKG